MGSARELGYNGGHRESQVGDIYSLNGEAPNWLPESRVKAPSDMVALGDVALYAVIDPSQWKGQGLPRPTGNGILLYDFGAGALRGTWANESHHKAVADAIGLRHRGRMNVALCDGHLESRKTAKLFEDSDQARKRFSNHNESHTRSGLLP